MNLYLNLISNIHAKTKQFTQQITLDENDKNIISNTEILPDEKHDWTFGIKIREVLPDERHDRTFGIKCCQTKGMTGLLELSVAKQKYCQMKILPDEKHDQTFGIKVRKDG
ncbi:hypothetical protein RclHR1_13710001 [Rhizophagus clarus]|uniref:Uncharacterized protein n=1 Tax=Rhizophagus clarus TaxID=94130 RepID=A0A2Z6QN99_9GLOM|nr:hypothetical protein RclHR1_13710001 [Rhizophagus clarus]